MPLDYNDVLVPIVEKITKQRFSSNGLIERKRSQNEANVQPIMNPTLKVAQKEREG